MKANTLNIMKSHYDIDFMSMFWGMGHLKSKNTRRGYNKMLKNKWKKEIARQANEELNDC